MRKKSHISCAYTLLLSLYGIAALGIPLAIYASLTLLQTPFTPLYAGGIALSFGGLVVWLGSWLMARPLKRVLQAAQTALQGFQGNAQDISSHFSICDMESAVGTIGKMAALGHEAIKGFRAMPSPAVLFDRSGTIISLSSGMRNLLDTEFSALRTPKGSASFAGEHISTLFGDLRCDHMFRHQNTPVVLKENSDIRITAALSQLNENLSRKEAGLIILTVENKQEQAQIGAPERAMIMELKNACATITDSFTAVSEFMQAIAKGDFQARITMDARGDLGRLVEEANQFAQHLDRLSTLLTARIASAQHAIQIVHAESDDAITATSQMQRSLTVAHNHFTTSTITDQSIAELFSGIHQATHLMEAEAHTTHISVVDAVNTHNKTMKLLNDMADFSTMLEDMGFHLKLLGLNAAVESARVDQGDGQNASLSELCRDIRALGARFRQASGEFREWIMPVHDQASMAQHMLATAQKSIMHIAPAATQVQTQLRKQEDIVRAALKPRIESAQALEHAMAHAAAAHAAIAQSSQTVGAIAQDLTELYELTTAVIPVQPARPQLAPNRDITKPALPETSANPVAPTSEEAPAEPDLSLDWFRRDILLRELSGELPAVPVADNIRQPRNGVRKKPTAA